MITNAERGAAAKKIWPAKVTARMTSADTQTTTTTLAKHQPKAGQTLLTKFGVALRARVDVLGPLSPNAQKVLGKSRVADSDTHLRKLAEQEQEQSRRQ